jgi:hypothetical protein
MAATRVRLADRLNLNGWSVGGGLANSNAGTGFLTATALDTLVPGTYRIAYTVVSNGGGDCVLVVGQGVLPDVLGPWEPGSHAFDWICTSAPTQLIRFKDVDGVGIVLSALSVKRYQT